MMILLWLVIGFGIYYIVTNDKHNFSGGLSHKPRPEEILKQRYVNGEIDEDTFNRMLQTIRK